MEYYNIEYFVLWLPEKAISCLSCWMPMLWSMQMPLDANYSRRMEVLLP